MKKRYLKVYNSLAIFNIIFCFLYILFILLSINGIIVLPVVIDKFILRLGDIFILFLVTLSALINLHYLKIILNKLED